MDRNTSNEPGYRPLGEAPAPQMPYGESDGLGVGSRQVLARMPNLNHVDPDTDPIDNFSYSGENRVISSGTSVKILAGIFVGICVLAVLGVVLVGGKSGTEATAESSAAPNSQLGAWQPQPPAPGAEQAPQWGAAPGNPSWQAGTGTNANSWNSPAPANGWNGQPAAVASGPTNGTQQGMSAPAPTGAWGNPTELTATPSQPVEPVWGQMQESTASAAATSSPWSPPAPTKAWNASPAPVAVDAQAQSAAWPAAAPSTTGMGATQAAYSDPRTASATPERSAAMPGYGGAYQPVQPAPVYGGSYGQPQAGVNQSMSLGGPSANPSANPSATPTAAWQQGAGSYRPNTGAQSDPRYNTGSSYSAVQTPYYQAVTPSTSTGNLYTADTRSSSTPNYNAGTLPNANYGNSAIGHPAAVGQPSYSPMTPAGGQPNGYPTNNGYPANTGSPANGGYPVGNPYPTNSGPAPNGGYSANPGYSANGGYSASGSATGYSSAYPANFVSPNYPVAAAPVGAPSAPQMGTMMPAPQSNGAQFEGTIEKPSVQANYDRTRPSLY